MKHSMSRTIPISILLLLIASAWSCGPSCKQVRQEQAKLSAERPKTELPHAVLTLSRVKSNQIIEQQVAELSPFTLPGPVALAAALLSLPTLSANVVSVRLVPTTKGHLAIAVEVDLQVDDQRFASVEFEVKAKPTIAKSKKPGHQQSLRFDFEGDSIVTLQAHLGHMPRELLGQLLHDHLPESIRAKIPRLATTMAAARLSEWITKEGFEQIRDLALRHIGPVTKLSFALANVPIERVAVRTDNPAYVQLELYTDLPVRHGLRPDSASVPTRSELMSVSISGSAAAELANWAIRTGHAPERYNRSLEPRADGLYRPVFDWIESPRPLQVHLFRGGKHCAHIHASATPILKLKNGKIDAGANNRKGESYVGPIHLRTGLWVKGLWWRFFDGTKKVTSALEMTLGNRVLHTELTSVQVNQKRLSVGLEVTVASKVASQFRRKKLHSSL